MKLLILILICLITITLILYYIIMKNKNTHIFSIQGKREYMEDTYCIYKDGNLKIYGVFDGHGGKEVSLILKDLVPSILKKKVFNNNNQIKTKIENVFIGIESILRQNINSNSVGSTACIFVKYNNKLYSINLGDSRLLLFKTKDTNILSTNSLVVETADHKPDKEKYRIKKSKGDVIFDGHSYRVNGNLAISRAFGDFYLKYDNTDRFKGPVSIKPDVYETNYDDKYNYYVVIGSDGLWDVLNTNDIISIHNHCVRKNIDNAAAVMGAVAYKKGSTDNITVLSTKI
jgi:serine/threonine protein phosphatase PrpC